MKKTFLVCALLAAISFVSAPIFAEEKAVPPIRALLITGGCCHDYAAQKQTLTNGISARANVVWTVVHEGDENAKDTKFSIYEKKNWAEGFDVIVHNECSGKVTDTNWVEHIAKAHFDGVPGVVIHCSIHSYRESTTDEWRKTLGVSSFRHQARRAFDVVNVQPKHPVMRGFPEKFHDDSDELYEIVKVWPNCVPLAKSLTPNKPGNEHPCIWVNTYGQGKIFGTTLGHLNETMQREEYLDLITRGLLWTCDKLDNKGKPVEGYGKEKVAKN